MQVAERPSLEQIRVFGDQRSSFAALTSDNGSKFINHTVAASKVAEAPCNDHGLAESKNGSVIRKHISYGHIASVHAEAFNQFYHERINPYLNFHQPCGVSEIVMSKKKAKPSGDTPGTALRGRFFAGSPPRPQSQAGSHCRAVRTPRQARRAIWRWYGKCELPWPADASTAFRKAKQLLTKAERRLGSDRLRAVQTHPSMRKRSRFAHAFAGEVGDQQV
jgi:hypothetical protein